MSIVPQYLYDSQGNKIGVFLSIDDWNAVEKNTSLEIIPEWEQRLALRHLEEYRRNPDAAIDAEDFFKTLDAEDT